MFKKFHTRQISVIALIAMMIISSLPSWPGSERARAFSPSEQEIMKAFDELLNGITQLSKTALTVGQVDSLTKDMKQAAEAFAGGDICQSAAIIMDFTEEARKLRVSDRSFAAEDLANRGWSLRQDILSMMPADKPCVGAERFNMPPRVEITESDNKHLRGTISFGEPKMWTVAVKGDLYTEIEIPGIQFGVGEPGVPGVPVLHRLIGVPQGAQAQVKFNVGKSQNLKVNLHPIQPEAKDSAESDKLQFPAERFKDPEFTKNEKIYGSDSPFPTETVSIRRLGMARDLQLAQLTVAAGSYIPATRELTLFESVDFEVFFEGGKGAFLNRESLNPFDNGMNGFYSSVINRETLFSFTQETTRKLLCGGEEFLILTHPDFRDAADRLAEWKHDKGITTRVFNVNDGGGSGPDTKEEIDEFIEGRFNWCGIRPSYILILGDAEFIEPFYVNTSGSSTTGTDYPYALLSGQNDDVPDFAIGRIPVDTLSQANTVVDKIINYESNPPDSTSFYKNVGIASQFQCCRNGGQEGRDQRSFIETSELVRDELIDKGYSVDRIYTETVDGGYTGDSTPRRFYNGTLLPSEIGADSGFAWGGDTDDIIDAFNAGRFLFLHRDHGWKDGWGHPEFTTTNVNEDLNNGSMLPVVFSVNCSSGLFDNETADGDYGTEVDHEYFAERLLRLENGGAVGMLGDTRDSPTWANSALTRGFFDAVWPNTVQDFSDNSRKRRLGDILTHGKLYLITQVGMTGTTTPAPSQWEATSDLYMWHALGDPTLTMWTSRPLRKLPYSFQAYWANTITLKIKYAAENAWLTAFQQTKDGVVHLGRARVKNGEANMQLLQRPVSGAQIQLIAGNDDDVSVNLTEKNGK